MGWLLAIIIALAVRWIWRLLSSNDELAISQQPSAIAKVKRARSPRGPKVIKPIAAIVAGIHYYDPDFVRDHCGHAKVSLHREPRNEHDANAIAVYMSAGLRSVKIGHLKAPLAKRLAPKMDQGMKFQARVHSFYTPDDRDFIRVSLLVTPVN